MQTACSAKRVARLCPKCNCAHANKKIFPACSCSGTSGSLRCQAVDFAAHRSDILVMLPGHAAKASSSACFSALAAGAACACRRICIASSSAATVPACALNCMRSCTAAAPSLAHWSASLAASAAAIPSRACRCRLNHIYRQSACNDARRAHLSLTRRLLWAALQLSSMH